MIDDNTMAISSENDCRMLPKIGDIHITFDTLAARARKVMDNLDSNEKRKVKELLKDKEKGDTKLEWLYKPNKPDSEEYLLGKRIDKHIEAAEEGPREDDVGAIFNERIKANIALDQAAKMREDPLFAIRRSEESARKRLLENPVKMRRLQLLLQNSQKEKKRAKKHKHKHKKDKRQAESSSGSDDDLVKKYLSILNKKQQKSTEKYGEKDTRTERHAHKEGTYNPEYKDTRTERHSHKEGTYNPEYKDTRTERHSHKEGTYNPEYKDTRTERHSHKEGTYNPEYKDTRTERHSHKEGTYNPEYKDTRTERHSHKEGTYNPEYKDTRRRHLEYESKRQFENNDRTNHRVDSSSKKKHKKHHKDSQVDSESDDDGKNLNYGLSLAKNKSQIIRSRSSQRRKSRSKSRSPMRALSKSSKPRRDRSPPPRKLTAEDREKKLREMMDNAKSHVERRKKNVHRYKEEQKQEDERQMKHKEDGAKFINPLLSMHASQSSIEDRIKRNAYKIQRTKAAMDKHFTKE